jgi:hyperosmotically inducible protein
MKTRTPGWPRGPARALLAASAITVLLAACSKAPEDTLSTPPSTTLSTQFDDTVITAGVKSALMADPDVKSLDLQVETRKGTVQLSGYVDNPAQIDRALAVVRGVAGVTGVENGVSVKGATATLGSRIDDTAVTTRVKTALLADADIKSLDISVLTVEGSVQLTGFVNSQAQVDRAAALAAAAEGARSVKNELKVKQ